MHIRGGRTHVGVLARWILLPGFIRRAGPIGILSDSMLGRLSNRECGFVHRCSPKVDNAQPNRGGSFLCAAVCGIDVFLFVSMEHIELFLQDWIHPRILAFCDNVDRGCREGLERGQSENEMSKKQE